MSSISDKKRILKIVLDLIFRLFALPFYLIFVILKMIIGPRKGFASVTQTVSLFPGVTGEWIRKGVLQLITKKSLIDCCISFGTVFSNPKVSIGDGVYIGTRCDIGYADIGRDCILGSGVHLLSGQNQHNFEDFDISIRDQGGTFKKILIGENTWIGNGAIISADVGNGCVIGAGSIVVSRIGDNSVAVGNPAKVIRQRVKKEENINPAIKVRN